MSRHDEKIVGLLAVLADLGKGRAQALGADAAGLVQDLVEVDFAKSEAAKPGERRLLSQQLFDGRSRSL